MKKPLVWYSMANIGPYALLPPVAVGLLLPGGLLLVRTGTSPQLAEVYIDFVMRLLAPAIAVWWPSFVFKERLEGDGRELLYFLKRHGEAVTALALALYYWILLVPFVLVALGAPGFSVESVPPLLARCLFMTTFAFCASFVLHSSALALIIALLFNMIGMMPFEGLIQTFMSTGTIDTGTSVSTILPYAALSTMLLLFGEVRSRHFAG